MNSSEGRFDANAYLDQMIAIHNLPIAPEWRPGVIENIERARQIATAFLSFPLPDDVEPAPVYKP